MTKDGSIYRAINVICSEHGKIEFLKTTHAFDKNDLDSGAPKKDVWNSLSDLYQNEDDFNMIDNFNVKMYALDVDDTISDYINCDELDWKSMQTLVEHIMYHYILRRNKKNKVVCIRNLMTLLRENHG